jgi:exodeoxyribonuclease V alpha subunit
MKAAMDPSTPPSSAPSTTPALRAWVDAGWLRELDLAFADFVAPAGADQDRFVHLAAALLSHQVGRGQVRLDLTAALADPAWTLDLPPEGGRGRVNAAQDGPAPPQPAELLAGLTLSTWLAALKAHPAVGDVNGQDNADGSTPMVLADGCLLLRRHGRCEQTIQQALAQRLQAPTLSGRTPAGPRAEDDDALRHALDALFPAVPPNQGASDSRSPDWQKIACALAARHAFAVITGGPGTGKTTTVVKLLVVLQHLARHQSQPLRIRLAAPTGKAAARLAESMASARGKLALDSLPGGPEGLQALPGEVSTLHRLLGVKPGSRHFRHDALHPLPLDVLVIDEASMVDLELMAAVLQALPRHARLVLLGDKDQLASVEAGAVLGTLCQRADGGHYTPATRAWVRQVTGQDVGDAMTDPAGLPSDQAIVKLRQSHRFGADSGIGRLAQAVHEGNAAAAQALLTQGLPDIGLTRELGSLHAGWRPLLTRLQQTRPAPGTAADTLDAWAREVLNVLSRFQVLCAVRAGPQGVESINRRMAQALAAEGLLPAYQGWFPGRPVMVTRNDYGLGLMNGDVGVTLPGPAEDAGEPPLRVAFPDGRGGIRWVPPSRLQDVETVFAMTVHKSQGSEFDHAVLVLPAHPSPVLTRSLVYTAITRARVQFTLVTGEGRMDVLQQAVQRTASGPAAGDAPPAGPGLEEALRKPEGPRQA